MINLSDFGAEFIPLRKNAKVPATNFRGRRFKPTELQSWLEQGGNLGLLCQPNFAVIDIDRGHNHGDVDGLLELKRWLKGHGIDLVALMKQTLAQVTPSGGVHLIFQQPEGMPHLKQVIGLVPGVDIKASENNYIVIQPSRINGKHYRLINELPPLPMPADLALLIEQQALANLGHHHQALGGHRSLGAPMKAGEVPGLLDLPANGLGAPGKRNDRLFRWALNASKETRLPDLIKVARIANQQSLTPLPEREVVATVRSAVGYGMKGHKNSLLATVANGFGTENPAGTACRWFQEALLVEPGENLAKCALLANERTPHPLAPEVLKRELKNAKLMLAARARRR